MDTFIPSPATTSPVEQNRLMNRLNPGSMDHLWKRQAPLHGLSWLERQASLQFSARLQTLSRARAAPERVMFPFRIYNIPANQIGDPTWSDAFGPANWRAFRVWTGLAQAWLIQTPGGGAPSGVEVAIPDLVYVARTSGYNLAPGFNYNNFPIIQEDQNEYYGAINTGNYESNPGNPDGTGPQDFAAAWQEITFVANPCSFAVFWVSWDTNNASGNPQYDLELNDQSYSAFPVLHFGGLDALGNYFGDLDSTNGPLILGQVGNSGSAFSPCYGGDTPQPYPFIPQYALSDDDSITPPVTLSSGTGLEGIVIIGAVQVGAYGALQNTGNDQILQLFQIQRSHLSGPIPRAQFRGAYSSDEWYYPNELVTESDTTYINATPLAILGGTGFPTIASQLSASPVSDGVEWGTYENLFMPIGGGNASNVIRMLVSGESTNVLICWGSGGSITQILITNGGAGYTGTVTVTISAPSMGVTATATSPTAPSGGIVTTITITNGGSGYTSPPTLTITGTHTIQATAIAGNEVVAKPPELQGFIGTASNTDAQGYTYEILQPYIPGTTYIDAETPVGGTGVTYGGVAVTLQDQNVGARAVAKLLPTCEYISGAYVSKQRYFVCSAYQ